MNYAERQPRPAASPVPSSEGTVFRAQVAPEPEQPRRGVVKSVGEAVSRSGRRYHQVELASGERYPVWGRKQLEGLAPGVEVEYARKRNERGFWNLTELRLSQAQTRAQAQTPAEPEPEAPAEAAPADVPASQPGVELVEGRAGPDHEPDDRQRQALSINSLNNATAIFAALVGAGLLRPTSADGALALVRTFYTAMMQLHQSTDDRSR